MRHMSDTIEVTVDGPPVTCDVTWEQVRAYLRRAGWEAKDGCPRRVVAWTIQNGAWIVYVRPQPWRAVDSLRSVIETVAEQEQRHPSAVLFDIARGAEPLVVEPMTEEEIAGLERSDEEWGRCASGFDALTVRRLLATVRAREALAAEVDLTVA